MARTVTCAKLGRQLPGLDKPPWPGDLGRRIYESISREAWRLWLDESTKLLNETRMDVTSPEAQKLYARQMEAFLFGGAETPSSPPSLTILPPDESEE